MRLLAEVLVSTVAVLACAGLAAGTYWQGTEVAEKRGRAAGFVGLAASGVGAGFLGSMFQSYTVRLGGSSVSPALDGSGAAPAGGGAAAVGGVVVPIGAAVGLVLLVVVLARGLTFVRSSLGVLIPAAGWLAMVGTFMVGSSKNDIILADNGQAQLYLYGGLLSAAGLAIWGQQVQLRDRLG